VKSIVNENARESKKNVHSDPTLFVVLRLPSDTSKQQSKKEISSSTPLKCLCDSGAEISCIDLQLVQSLGIPLEVNEDSSIEAATLMLANGSTVKRIGRTVRLPFNLFFMEGERTEDEQAIAPIIDQLSYQFEVLSGVHSGQSDDHWILFGKDLMSRTREILSKRNKLKGKVDSRYLSFIIGNRTREDEAKQTNKLTLRSIRVQQKTLIKRYNRLKLASLQTSKQGKGNQEQVKLKADLSQTEQELQDSAVEYMSQELDDLEPSKANLFTETDKENEYSSNRQRILSNAAICEQLEINSRITSPCSFPGSTIHLRLKAEFENEWWKLSRRQYPIPAAKRKAVSEQVRVWESRDKVERIDPSSDSYHQGGYRVINNPLLAVPKVSGGEVIPDIFRTCIDPRLLNSWLDTDDKFEIPHIRKSLEKFANKKIFGELDLEEAFLQFLVDKDSRHLLAFTWDGVQYQFKGMPFGVKFMTNFCHRIVSAIFQSEGLTFVDPYVDNLPFASNTWKEHEEQLLAILKVCNKYNLKVKQKGELKIGHSSMQCLGHIVTREGVKIDPRKAKSIRDWPLPSTGAEMSSFLGFAGYVQQHVRHYAELAASLNAVKDQKIIQWNDRMRKDFDTLKRAIVDSPMLIYPDFSKPFCIATDASNSGCGGVLYQPVSNQDMDITPTNIVAICSHKWNETQRNYSAYKKELYGLVYCLRKFHEYVWGQPDTIVFTDHKPLTYLFSQKELPVPLQQFVDHILDYSFELHHRPGILNVLPDALSRMYERVYTNPVWGVPANIRLSPELLEEFKSSSEQFDEKGRPQPHLRALTRSERKSNSLSEHSVNSNSSQSRGFRQEASTEGLSEDQLRGYLLMEAERRGKRLLTDEAEQNKCIQQEHKLGHFGRDAIYDKLYKDLNVWWPGMRSSILRQLRKCDACARFNLSRNGFKPAEYIIAKGVWSHIQIDCTELPPSDEGYTTLLAIVDVFTGFVVLYPMKKHDAGSVAERLWELFSLFGLPDIIQSDNGVEFRNQLIARLNQLLQIDHRFTAPYNPRCDGKVERVIETVKNVIKKFLLGAEHHWPKFLPLAQLSVNSKYSALISSTPFALVFGREARQPLSSQAHSSSTNSELTLDEWKRFQKMINEIVYPSILERVIQKKKRMVEKLNSRRPSLNEHDFPNGSLVMIKDHSRKSKLQPEYVGRYEVVAKDQSGNLILKSADNRQQLLSRPVPPDQAKAVEYDPDQESIYEVDKLLDHRTKNGVNEYRVLWKGYSEADATWEPESNFMDHEIIRKYHQQTRNKSKRN